MHAVSIVLSTDGTARPIKRTAWADLFRRSAQTGDGLQHVYVPKGHSAFTEVTLFLSQPSVQQAEVSGLRLTLRVLLASPQLHGWSVRRCSAIPVLLLFELMTIRGRFSDPAP